MAIPHNYSVENIGSSSSLNTQGCCFICLRETVVTVDDDKDNYKIGTAEEFVSLLEICRRLTINSGVFKGRQCYSPIANDIRVHLCKDCRVVTERFSKLSNILDKTKLEMDYCLEIINKRTSEARKVPELFQNYSRKMTRNPDSLAQLLFVDKLRKQVSIKSSEVRFKASPKIHLQRIDGLSGNTMIGNSLKSKSTTQTSSGSPKKRKRRKPSQKYVFNSSTGKYSCKICQKEWVSSAGVTHHFNAVHLNRVFKCDLCKTASFNTKKSLLLHQALQVCSSVNAYQSLSREEKRKYYRHECSLCKKKFYTLQNLQMHQETVHSNVRKFPCDRCEKGFKFISHLNEHKAVVHLGKVYCCKFCNKTFKSKAKYRPHVRLCSADAEVKSVKMENNGSMTVHDFDNKTSFTGNNNLISSTSSEPVIEAVCKIEIL